MRGYYAALQVNNGQTTFAGSWEECAVSELVPGDVVSHVKLPGSNWHPVETNDGSHSAGWRVDSEDQGYVLGYILLEDGSRPAVLSNLFPIGSTYMCKVIPWDRPKPSVPELSDKWNDKCPTCSKGIYVGFNASRTNPSEHDGPCRT